MSTLLVTGAEGFVGSRLIQYLRSEGHKVVAGVRNRARKLAYERDQIPALVCDVTDAINVARVVASARPDGVVHLAGIARPGPAAAEPLLAYQSIVTAWANVLDGVRRTVPRARVLMVSAADVYGNAGADGRMLAETAATEPVSTFGSLKRTAETIAETFHRDYQLDVSIARPFQYVGAGLPTRFFLGAVAQQLATWNGASGAELRLADLSCRRDWLHVDDVVRAYAKILLEGRPNETYNVCSGQATTMQSRVESLVQQSGHSIRVSELPQEDDDDQVTALCGDNGKLRQELGWSPQQTVDEGLRELMSSYQNQQTPAHAPTR